MTDRGARRRHRRPDRPTHILLDITLILNVVANASVLLLRLLLRRILDHLDHRCNGGNALTQLLGPPVGP